jgi:hypothetical protein
MQRTRANRPRRLGSSGCRLPHGNLPHALWITRREVDFRAGNRPGTRLRHRQTCQSPGQASFKLLISERRTCAPRLGQLARGGHDELELEYTFAFPRCRLVAAYDPTPGKPRRPLEFLPRVRPPHGSDVHDDARLRVMRPRLLRFRRRARTAWWWLVSDDRLRRNPQHHGERGDSKPSLCSRGQARDSIRSRVKLPVSFAGFNPLRARTARVSRRG